MAPGGKTNAVRLRPDTRIQELDAIRGLAILLVMVQHYAHTLIGVPAGPAPTFAVKLPSSAGPAWISSLFYPGFSSAAS
jgi:peptidoglycan/LPS O-acetylase OafA/YrhL